MKARHVSSDAEYRKPFGAVQLGGTVMLSVDVWGDDVLFCTLRLWTEEEHEQFIEMRGERRGDALRFSASYTPKHTGVVWYSFDIEATDGSVWRYGAKPGCTTGEGAFAYGDPPSFQITVFEPRAEQPEWYREGVVYQIFPDRFFRGSDWEERSEAGLAQEFKGTARALVEDWDTPATYLRRPDNSIERWDFYGGTLKGIEEKLDYLQNLGASILYLNPIFAASSNHRYDTADYLRIDPFLGDEDAFKSLCAAAHARGMHVILDGVFNHCGADSRYFNRFGSFKEPGAWQAHEAEAGGAEGAAAAESAAESPYAGWFSFNDDGSYAGWWGNPDMPAFREVEAYREFICGKDGVVRRWMRAGADGWRLDVADELTDDFIVQIKEAVLAEKPDAVLIGEVWEDASHKVAYGKLRQYFEGKELDGTMNYPVRTALLAFMRNEINAPELERRLEELHENYPEDNFYSALNLLGSHDRERLFTMLGGAPDPDSMSEEERAAYRLNDGQAGLATSRLWAIALLQMTLPGVPCVYYGDECGLEGFRDPFNRASFPWEGERRRKDCYTIYRNAIALRRALPVLTTGDFDAFSSGEDVFGFWRRDAEGNAACVLVNASLGNAHTVKVPMVSEYVSDVVSGRAPKVSHGQAEVFLWPLGTAVLYFSKVERLQAPLEPGMGVLCHITSVPNAGKPGTLGAPSRAFVDWLAEGGQKYWQVLPVNPADQFGSPYAGLAASAGNTTLLELSEEEALAAHKNAARDAGYKAFCKKNASWLTPYCCFRAIKELVGEDVPWQDWPAEWLDYKPSMANEPRLVEAFEKNRILQYEFELEWSDLLAYAHKRGIKVIGDMPMYVSGDSADVWSERKVFDLGTDGRASMQAGAPGDSFAPEGQLWGNPTYRWDYLRSTGYDWWMRRFERAFELYDYVRLDHFIGFSSYYSVPEGKPASEGSYSYGPGVDLFEAARKRFGQLPLIAEDLGLITPAVRALVAAVGAPGMDVVQFADCDVREGYEPHAGTVSYTGTHDNQTLVGFCESRFGLEGEAAVEMADKIMARVLRSDAPVAIVQLQDVLSLDDTARMNVPGTAENNWSWHSPDVTAYTARLKELAGLRP